MVRSVDRSPNSRRSVVPSKTCPQSVAVAMPPPCVRVIVPSSGSAPVIAGFFCLQNANEFRAREGRFVAIARRVLLVRAFHGLQIGHVAAPDLHGGLRRPAGARKKRRVDQLSVVAERKPVRCRNGLDCVFTASAEKALRGYPALTARAVAADVGIRMLPRRALMQRKGARGHSLRLERLSGKIGRHLRQQHAGQIVLQAHLARLPVEQHGYACLRVKARGREWRRNALAQPLPQSARPVCGRPAPDG